MQSTRDRLINAQLFQKNHKTTTPKHQKVLHQGTDMNKKRLARLSGLLIGISMTIPLAQAADVILRSEPNVRPFSLTDPEAPVRTVNREVEVFVRFDLPSVAEFNAQAMQAGGNIPGLRPGELVDSLLSMMRVVMSFIS